LFEKDLVVAAKYHNLPMPYHTPNLPGHSCGFQSGILSAIRAAMAKWHAVLTLHGLTPQ
jgi:hypothetical protein